MYRQNIHFPAKDAPLREDVHALGALVGDILREQCGEALFDLVEGNRVDAIRRREGDPEGAPSLFARARGRDPAEARDLVRAFSTWFQAVNLAEKVHRIRRRRQYLNDTAHPQPGGIEDTLQRLQREGRTLDDVRAMLGSVCVYPVFTSHPTESTRRTTLRKQQRIAGLMLDRLDPSITPGERRATWEQIRTEFTSGWQTEEHPRERLTVADEREHVLFYLAEVLYRIVPGFYEELAAALERVYGVPVAPRELPRVLRFGSWVGGDMDGNPDVHAKTIRETLFRQHQVVVNNYFLDVHRLAERLSQSASRVPVSPELAQRIEEYGVLLPSAQGGGTASRHDRMPYRVFCGQVAERLRLTYDGMPNHYESAAQLGRDVRLMADSLAAHRGRHAGLFYVERLLRRIDTFGFHLATLDVRQDAGVHRDVVAQGLGDPGFVERPVEQRLARLRIALERDEGPTGTFDATGRRTRVVFEALMHGRHRYGRDAIGEYVVGGAQGPDDVLAVLLLARWSEMVDKRNGQVPLDVAPLFETVECLDGSGATMRALLAEPLYRAHVAARGDTQTAMIGYSDTNKESGYAAARWALHRAQSRLAEAGADAGVRLTVFHGRGGVGRGGGRVDTLLRSMPARAFRGTLRVTEQGEVVNTSYGLRPIALRTFEQSFGAASLALAGVDRRPHEEAAFRAALDTLAEASRASYRSLVHDDPAFREYFRLATPIDVIERMQIGSRPAAREGRHGLDALRAVPWGFAWSQSRHLVPGWYGMGAGLAAVATTHGDEIAGQMLAHWPFFAGLIDEVEMVLATADMDIAGWYAALAGPGLRDRFETIRAEYERTRDAILKLRGVVRLLDGEPTLQRAIKLRNPYVDPIHLMQLDLLQRWRADGRRDRQLFDALVASIGGIAQGLQATG
jgi:phosphoenolpyruvate carboxylase